MQWRWQNPLPQGNNLRDATLVNANIGTLVGDYGTIVRTTDGGNNWSVQSSGTTETLWGVSFTDSNSGTVVGEKWYDPPDHRWWRSLDGTGKWNGLELARSFIGRRQHWDGRWRRRRDP